MPKFFGALRSTRAHERAHPAVAKQKATLCSLMHPGQENSLKGRGDNVSSRHPRAVPRMYVGLSKFHRCDILITSGARAILCRRGKGDTESPTCCNVSSTKCLQKLARIDNVKL